MLPIITIHGDADPVVPYSEATRFHEALGKANTPDQFYTIHGGGHGQFTTEDNRKAYGAIVGFLANYRLWPVARL